MELEEIAPLIFFAIGGMGVIWLLLYWSSSFNSLPVLSIPSVLKYLDILIPNFKASKVLLSANKKSAIAIETNNDQAAVMFVLGGKVVAKKLDKTNLLHTKLLRPRGGGPVLLNFDIADFACPKIDLVLETNNGNSRCTQWDVRGTDYDLVTSVGDGIQEIGEHWFKRFEKIASGRK